MPGLLCRHLRAVLLVLAVFQSACGDQLITAPDTANLPAGVALPLVRMSGWVYEVGPFRDPVLDATVEVTGAFRVSAKTGPDGEFALDVPRGAVRVRIVKDGYRTHESTVIALGDVAQDFTVAPAFTPLDVHGSYRLTIEAAASCRQGGLPPELWTRQYPAVVAQDEFALEMKLIGASFEGPFDQFFGRVDVDRLRFSITRSFFQAEIPPSILERVGPNYLSFGGWVVVPLDGSPGTFSGTIELFANHPSLWEEPVRIAECTSEHHRFVLTR